MDTNFNKCFNDLQADFYHYMITFGKIAPKTGLDYVTRLKFLSNDYRLDESITEEYIDYILNQEKTKQLYRSVYASKKSISDFQSGLRKFLAFTKSDYKKQHENSILSEIKAIKKSHQLSITEKSAIIQARIGQGYFRKGLIEYWKGCSITGCEMTALLIASHIKPWRDSNNIERLDSFNGLLLLPNFDRLFDLGYLSFNPKGKIILSKFLSLEDRALLGLTDSLSLIHIEERHKFYLRYHNNYCFMG